MFKSCFFEKTDHQRTDQDEELKKGEYITTYRVYKLKYIYILTNARNTLFTNIFENVDETGILKLYTLQILTQGEKSPIYHNCRLGKLDQT